MHTYTDRERETHKETHHFAWVERVNIYIHTQTHTHTHTHAKPSIYIRVWYFFAHRRFILYLFSFVFSTDFYFLCLVSFAHRLFLFGSFAGVWHFFAHLRAHCPS